jgi:hypothetical protein
MGMKNPAAAWLPTVWFGYFSVFFSEMLGVGGRLPQGTGITFSVVASESFERSNSEIAPEWDAFIASVGRPATQARIKALMERGFHTPGDAENRLGYYVGQLAS